MSSPSPGKRRMDTDVIKLYPCRSLGTDCGLVVLWLAKSRAIMALSVHILLFFFSVSISLFLDYILIRIESKHEVTILGGLNEFIVKFFGPSGSKCEHIFMF